MPLGLEAVTTERGGGVHVRARATVGRGTGAEIGGAVEILALTTAAGEIATEGLTEGASESPAPALRCEEGADRLLQSAGGGVAQGVIAAIESEGKNPARRMKKRKKRKRKRRANSTRER